MFITFSAPLMGHQITATKLQIISLSFDMSCFHYTVNYCRYFSTEDGRNLRLALGI